MSWIVRLTPKWKSEKYVRKAATHLPPAAGGNSYNITDWRIEFRENGLNCGHCPRLNLSPDRDIENSKQNRWNIDCDALPRSCCMLGAIAATLRWRRWRMPKRQGRKQRRRLRKRRSERWVLDWAISKESCGTRTSLFWRERIVKKRFKNC